MKVSYCKSWFRARKIPTEIWTQDEAEAAHEAGTLYTVLLGPTDAPNIFLEVTGSYVGVGFLDEFLREQTTYQFQKKDADRLFLSSAVHRTFIGESDKIHMGTVYFFSPDGSVKIDETDYTSNSTKTAQSMQAVGTNWEDFPTFGDYTSIARFER